MWQPLAVKIVEAAAAAAAVRDMFPTSTGPAKKVGNASHLLHLLVTGGRKRGTPAESRRAAVDLFFIILFLLDRSHYNLKIHRGGKLI